MLRFLDFKNICKMFAYTTSMESGGEGLLKVELMRLLILGGLFSRLSLFIDSLLECLVHFCCKTRVKFEDLPRRH